MFVIPCVYQVQEEAQAAMPEGISKVSFTQKKDTVMSKSVPCRGTTNRKP